MQNDVTYIAIILGLFVLAFLFVAACDKIVGRSEEAIVGDSTGDPSPVDIVPSLEGRRAA